MAMGQSDKKQEGAERDPQQGDYYTPVSTEVTNKEDPKKKRSSGLDGNREGAEMNDLYSPQAGVGLVSSGNNKKEKEKVAPQKDMTAVTDEHEQRGEPSGTVMSGPGLVEAGKGMANEASETLVHLRGRVMDKLSALQLPSESLEAVRKTFETGLKGAYTTTIDAVQRTKQSLLDILPSSLSTSTAKDARKVVEDMERDMLRNSEGSGESQVPDSDSKANVTALPTSGTIPPFMCSKL